MVAETHPGFPDQGQVKVFRSGKRRFRDLANGLKVLPASDPTSASILRSVDPKTCPGNVYHRPGDSWKMADDFCSLDFACPRLCFPQLFILSAHLCSLGTVSMKGQQREMKVTLSHLSSSWPHPIRQPAPSSVLLLQLYKNTGWSPLFSWFLGLLSLQPLGSLCFSGCFLHLQTSGLPLFPALFQFARQFC